ncbi:hypothetical protein [Candidatus Chloroploca asiatica]|uniref:Uncharacterized protein n=1 Tax=Candidatus Chloroploca asiatica TaxID=1506545 RepID=A0A2H3KVY5_9CHLR|nr:hypothetical protein [Candidatus Chloroploca asiatica]PDV96511.1 hypothetical protein A9Q02_20685 [Candidatus Chloroploca asiatica]
MTDTHDTPDTLAETDDPHATIDDLHRANRVIQQAQRQITRGLSDLAEGIVSLSLILLEVRRRRLYRFDPAAPTFEQFVVQRHGISAQHAKRYVDALTALGPQQYHTLLSDLGFQRTYALAMLQHADPTLVTAFQALPTPERHAVTVAQIEAVDATVTAELRRQVAQLEQAITREQGLLQQTRRRLHDVEDLHQRVTSDLIEERDTARHALDQEQAQTERLRRLLRDASPPPATPDATRRPSASGAAPLTAALPAPSPAPPVTEAVVVVVTCDVGALLSDIRAVQEKLARLTQLRRDDLPSTERQALAEALRQLAATLQTLRATVEY